MPTSAYVTPQIPTIRQASPIVKWVGGKGRILPQLQPLLPPGVELLRHVEPFAGGAAMFFAQQPKRALLCDVNPDLVNTYECVRDDVNGVIRALQRLAHKGFTETTYYRVRALYNAKGKTARNDRAAMFVYLNKTCFNGLHRVNRRGEFNVPMGRYANPRILDEEGLRAASDALQAADIRCTGFESLLENARPGDFVYLDPPYAPVSETANFTAYATDGFTHEDQRRLRDVYRELDRRGCRLMLSNSDVSSIRDLYKQFSIRTVMAPRAVNSDAKKRNAVSEVVVTNY